MAKSALLCASITRADRPTKRALGNFVTVEIAGIFKIIGTVIRHLGVLFAVTFIGWRTADLCYHLMLFAGLSIDDKIITFVVLAAASLIAALVGLAAFLLVRGVQNKEVVGFLGCGPLFWKRTWLVVRAALGAVALAIFLLLLLPLVGVNLRLRWIVAQCAIVIGLSLLFSGERSMALLRRARIFGRSERTGKTTARMAPSRSLVPRVETRKANR